MKVLYLTDSLADLDGIGRYAMRLIAALERVEPGLGVEVLLARKHPPTSSQVPAHWKVGVALPPTYFFNMSPPRFWASLFPAVWRTWRAARGADLVHAIKDYPHSLIGLLGARLAGVPCVATLHGTYTVQPLISRRHRRLARWTMKRFAGMISVSGYTRRRMLEVLAEGEVDPERVKVVPNCVDAEHYAAPRNTGDKPWRGRTYTLTVAELKERKGHHLGLAGWMRVARELPDLHHYVVGRMADDDYVRALSIQVAEAGLADRVHFLGTVDEDEKIDLLQNAAVFLHTPIVSSDGGFEGFGIVYLEAAACGRPAVGTLRCGAEDAIADGETGFLVDHDPAAVAGALRRLLGDAELRARLGAAGRRRAADMDWDGNAEEVLALYREALTR